MPSGSVTRMGSGYSQKGWPILKIKPIRSLDDWIWVQESQNGTTFLSSVWKCGTAISENNWPEGDRS